VNLKQLINYQTALSLSATAQEVKKLFNKMQVTHLPIVEQEKFLGCIRLEDSKTMEENKSLDDYRYMFNRMAISEEDNWMDILREFARQNANILPILDQNEQYIGILELEDLLHLLGRKPFLSEAGAVLVIETATHHYSPSEVSQIIESNNGKILGLLVTSFSENNIECTIKLNSNNLNEITQTLRRYGYTIKSEHIEDSYTQGLKDRSKYLKKFLNI